MHCRVRTVVRRAVLAFSCRRGRAEPPGGRPGERGDHRRAPAELQCLACHEPALFGQWTGCRGYRSRGGAAGRRRHDAQRRRGRRHDLRSRHVPVRRGPRTRAALRTVQCAACRSLARRLDRAAPAVRYSRPDGAGPTRCRAAGVRFAGRPRRLAQQHDRGDRRHGRGRHVPPRSVDHRAPYPDPDALRTRARGSGRPADRHGGALPQERRLAALARSGGATEDGQDASGVSALAPALAGTLDAAATVGRHDGDGRRFRARLLAPRPLRGDLCRDLR